MQKLQRKRKGAALWRGSIIHEAIQAKVTGGDWREPIKQAIKQYQTLWEDDQLKYQEIPQLPAIMEGYFKRYKGDGLTYEYVEHEFQVELAPGIVFVFKPDAIARDKQSRRWLVEHKSHKRMPNEDVRTFNLQTLLYVWALHKVGILVDGVMWDYIRPKAPTKPKLLEKSGRLEMRANLDTTKEVYLAAINEHGLNPKDYADYLETLEGREDRFYTRRFLPIKPEPLDIVAREAVITAKTMRAIGYDYPNRNITRDCTKCDFFPLCSAELFGRDSEFIRKAEYELRKKEVEEVDGEDEGDDSEE